MDMQAASDDWHFRILRRFGSWKRAVRKLDRTEYPLESPQPVEFVTRICMTYDGYDDPWVRMTNTGGFETSRAVPMPALRVWVAEHTPHAKFVMSRAYNQMLEVHFSIPGEVMAFQLMFGERIRYQDEKPVDESVKLDYI